MRTAPLVPDTTFVISVHILPVFTLSSPLPNPGSELISSIFILKESCKLYIRIAHRNIDGNEIGAAMLSNAIPVDIEGATVLVELSSRRGEQEISGGIRPSFKNIGDTITKISKEMSGAIQAAKPRKATIEFGCDFALEAGQLTTLIVSGSGSASLKITLEWVSNQPISE